MITYGAVTVYHQGYDPHGRMDCWSQASYPAVACLLYTSRWV